VTDVIDAAAAARLPVAVASNNSAAAIVSYLDSHDLASGIAAVVAALRRPVTDEIPSNSVIRVVNALDVSPTAGYLWVTRPRICWPRPPPAYTASSPQHWITASPCT